MSATRIERSPFVKGVGAGLPVTIIYFPIALTFGLLAVERMSIVLAVSMSALVYAGASQFMALELIGTHAAALEIVIATVLMNFRHFVMSASFSQRLERHRPAATPPLAFWLTDETFSLAMASGKTVNPRYMLGLELTSYVSWVSGTSLGFAVGSLIPPLLQESMYIALYALFVALLVPHVRRSLSILATAFFAAGFNVLLQRFQVMQPGWSLVTAILLTSILGALIHSDGEDA
jgi:4-azaleucine resistance transporter AzlC